MAKYLLQGNYVGEGVKGLLKEGGTSRRANAEKAAKSLSGTVEAFYYAFGDSDIYTIIDLPDNASAAALALLINASGAVVVKTTVLMTPEDPCLSTTRPVIVDHLPSVRLTARRRPIMPIGPTT